LCGVKSRIETNQESEEIMTDTKWISVLCWTRQNKHGWVVDLCDSESSETLDQFEHENEAWAFAREYAAKHGLEIKL